MPSSRRGDLARLALFLAAAALLGHWQASRSPGRTLVQEGVTAIAVPFIAGVSAVAGGVRNAAATLQHAESLAAENRRLRSEIEALRSRNASLTEEVLERERLRALLKLRSNLSQECISAAVIGRQLSRWPTAIILDRGRADGVRPRQPVVAAAGLVGRIYSATAHSALAIPVTDPNSAAGAIVQRSRAAGILEGDGDLCHLDYLPLDADVKPGDIVITSGLGGIFPKGILIGAIESVSRDDTAGTQSAAVRPSVDLSRLEEVLVICK